MASNSKAAVHNVAYEAKQKAVEVKNKVEHAKDKAEVKAKHAVKGGTGKGRV